MFKYDPEKVPDVKLEREWPLKDGTINQVYRAGDWSRARGVFRISAAKCVVGSTGFNRIAEVPVYSGAMACTTAGPVRGQGTGVAGQDQTTLFVQQSQHHCQPDP